MYLVLSALTSSPISLVAASKASAFQNFRIDTLNMLLSIYTASTFVPSCLKNVTISTGKTTRPASLQARRCVKSSNTKNESLMIPFYCPTSFKNIHQFGRNIQALTLFGKEYVPWVVKCYKFDIFSLSRTSVRTEFRTRDFFKERMSFNN